MNTPNKNIESPHISNQDVLDLAALSAETLEFTSRLIEHRLKEFGVMARVVAAYPGPVITRYEIELAIGGVGSYRISELANDLARALSVDSIRATKIIH